VAELSKIKNRLVALFAGGVLGAVAILGTIEFNELTSTPEFCGNACHSMSAYISSDPHFLESLHQTSPSGIHAECADCHLPDGFFRETWAHISSGTRDLYETLTSDFTDPSVWEARRAGLAHRVRNEMLANDSENCRSCHVREKLQPARERGQRQHYLGEQQGLTCIACHFDLVHRPVERSESFINATQLKDDH
jgi:nitrate/TMAO reductase-like tetraheme cytochrome c subunit